MLIGCIPFCYCTHSVESNWDGVADLFVQRHILLGCPDLSVGASWQYLRAHLQDIFLGDLFVC